jgi:hypothetical protein
MAVEVENTDRFGLKLIVNESRKQLTRSSQT